MKFLSLAIVFLGLNAQAYYIWADRNDVSCVGSIQADGAHLEVLVKGKTVVDLLVGKLESEANAGVAYCEGVLSYAKSIKKNGVYIDTQTSLVSGRLLTVDRMTCH